MHKVFWTLIAAELCTLAVLFVIGLNSPSDSGGREMGLIFGVALPFILILSVAALYWKANSPAVRTVALVLAAAPVAALAVAWGRNLLPGRHSSSSGGFGPEGQALAEAISRGNAAKVRELAAGSHLNQPSDSDLTFLTLALWKDTPSTLPIVQALLQAGADPNLASNKGWTLPLVRAILLKQPTLVEALLHAGADPNRRDAYGNVAYHTCLQYPDDTNFAIFKQLLDARANLEATDGGEKTALMVAAIFGNARAMGLLLDRGANRRARDKDGRTPLDFTLRRIEEQRGDAGMESVAARLKTGG